MTKTNINLNGMNPIISDIILNTDSYKTSHHLQYPVNRTRGVNSYVESRGGVWVDEQVFLGLQPYLMQYLSEPVTRDEIEFAADFLKDHGVPFHREGWEHILDTHGGYLPLVIEAIPEGMVLPASNVLVQVRNTDPKAFWLTSYIETALLRAIWYPTTVSTQSREIKKEIMSNLMRTSDNPEQEIGFKLHDFGARGVSSKESAGLGAMAHLVNFLGTDTIEGALYARMYYGESMAGFSIPASEHSTITSWGQQNEVDAFRNMLQQYGGTGPLLACVSDSYNIYDACSHIWGTILKKEVEECGSTVVVRPDSGDPTKVPVDCVEMLADKFGVTINQKGFKVLPDCIRVIQGDGINIDSITTILDRLEQKGFAGDNIAFGMGGALLQNLNRDTLKFAMKANATLITQEQDGGMDGHWFDTFKDPITDHGKKSKKGILSLVETDSGVETIRRSELNGREDLLQPVWKDGELLRTTTFADIRERAAVL